MSAPGLLRYLNRQARLSSYQLSSIRNSRKVIVRTMSDLKGSSSVPEKSAITIGTHSGPFHCDDALACYMLKQLPEYRDAKIIRSRDPKILDTCAIVVDVGDVFDHGRKRYDHHQITFNHTFTSLRPDIREDFTVKLSSAGLIFAYYGEDVVRDILAKHGAHDIPQLDFRIIIRQLYKSFMQEIDGIDNGVPMFDAEPRYTISTHLSSRVSDLNPSWFSGERNYDERFQLAMELVGKEFTEAAVKIGLNWIKGQSIVRDAIEEADKVYETGEILELKILCPWKKHLQELEKVYCLEGITKYVIYQQDEGDWRVICVPVNPSSFVLRKPLIESWRGLRNDELVRISGIPDIVFVHHSGFIAGAKSRDAALQIAIRSLKA